MSTPLTLFGSLTTSATLPSANTFIANVTGGSTSTHSTKIGTATGYGQVYAQGTTAAWPALGSLGAPDGNGILWDVTTLEGQTIVAGNWTPTVRLYTGVGSIVADIYLRAYVFDGLNFTQIGGALLLSGQAINTTITNYTFAPTALPARSFHVGEKLYVQVDLNITTNSTGSSSAVVKFAQSTSTTKGSANCQIITPGYQAATTGARSTGLRVRVASPTARTRVTALRTKVRTQGRQATTALRLSVREADQTIAIGGNLVQFDESSFKLSPKLDERWRLQFTVLDYTGTQVFSYGQAVIVYDYARGKTLFSGFVADDKVDKTNTYPSPASEHQIDCIDNRHKADKRTSDRLYTTPTYAGKIAMDMLADVLSAEGVVAEYVTATTQTTTDWGTGTLSGTVATGSVGDGDLELASSATTGAFYLAQGDWTGGGTFSSVHANADGSLALVGASRMWNDGVFSGQTLYGVTSPGESKSITQGVTSGRYYLTCPAADESHARLDFAGFWKNGVIEVDMNVAKDGLIYSLEYRTTNWNNNNETYAYAVEMTTASIKLKRGSNGGVANNATTLATKTFPCKLGTGWYRVRVAVSGSSHTISHNGKQDLSVSDGAYTAAGQIGLRNRNPGSCAATALFDNFGVLAALSGTWTSAATDLSGVTSVTSSQITWDASASTGGTVAVAASLDGGSTYQPCSNGGLIPGLAPGASGTGLTLVIKVTLTTTSTVLLPRMRNLVWSIVGGYASSGTRTTAPGTMSDTFVRANQAGWGMTVAGQNWVQDVGLGVPSIASNTGQIAASAVDTTMKLVGGTHADSSTVVNVQFALSTDYAYVYARFGSGASAYYRVLFGTNVIQINKWIASTSIYTTLASSTPTIAASTHYSVRFQVVGTTLSARYWIAGTTEPGTWALTATDSDVTSGLVALGASGNGAGGSLVSFDSLSVTLYQSAGLDLSPVGRCGATFISWNANVPAACSLEMDISFDGTNWTDISDQNGQPIPGIFTQPDPTVDTFGSDTRANYIAATGGSPAMWAADIANARLIATGGSAAFYLNNTLQNADVDLLCDLDYADTGGLVWNYTDSSTYYLCSVTDRQATSSTPEMLTLSRHAALPWLHVANGRITNAAGAPVFLCGVNTAGLEFGDAVDSITQARITALKARLGVNLFRVAINVAWWNSNVLLPDGVTHYRAWIGQVIGWIKGASCYVEIDPTTWITLLPNNSSAYCTTLGNPPLNTVASDTFTRANQSGWGTASDEKTWAALFTAPTTSIVSNEGEVTAGDGGMQLGSGTATDQTGLVRFALTETTDPRTGILLRTGGSNTYYLAYAMNGLLVLNKDVAGSDSNLVVLSRTYTSGTFYWMRFAAIGSTLSVRTWTDGTTEPTTWEIQVTDTSITSGGYGLYGKAGAGDIVKLDHFSVGTPATSCITSQNTLNNPPWTQAQIVAAVISFYQSFLPLYKNDAALLYDAINEPADFWGFTDPIGANVQVVNAIQAIHPGALIFVYGRPDLIVDGGTADYTQANLVWDFHIYDDPAYTWQQKLQDFLHLFNYAKLHNHGIMIGEWNVGGVTDATGFANAIQDLVLTQGAATAYYYEENLLSGDNVTLTTEGVIVAAIYQAILATPTVPVSYAAVIQIDGPISYYRLDERIGAGAYDFSGNGYTGSFNGTPTMGVAGLLSSDTDTAMSLPGSSACILLPSTGLPTGAQPWSIECWVKISSQPTSTQAIFSMGTGFAAAILYLDATGIVHAWNNADVSSGHTLSLNTPHHLVATYDGATLTLFIDGVILASGTMTGSITAFRGVIGAQTDTTQSFVGIIDELATYGYALSAAQVGAHHQAGTGILATLPVGNIPGSVGTTTLGSAAISFVRGSHHRLRANRQGSTLQVLFDGDAKITASDSSPLGAGLMGLYQDGGQARYSQLWLQPLGDDLTGVTLYTRQVLTTTDSSVSPQVLDLTVAAFSTNIDLGVLIPSADYRQTFVDKNYDDLAKQSNYSWFFDPDNHFHFHHRTAYPAPWILQSNALGLASDLVVDTNLLLEVANDLYRNRQVLKGVINTGLFQDPFSGDSKRTAFTLSYPIAPGTVPTISLNGNKQKVGKKGTTGAQWYYAEGDATIAEDTTGTVLLSTDTLTVSYTGTFADTIVVDNLDAQAALLKVEGGTGIVEAVEDVSQKSMTYPAGLVYAQQLLARYGTVDNQNRPGGRTYTFTTYRDGLAVGQILTTFVPEENQWNAQLLVTTMDIGILTQPGRTVLYKYLVTVSEVANVGSWQKLLASGLFD